MKSPKRRCLPVLTNEASPAATCHAPAQDPFFILGCDLFVLRILPLLDDSSLAACTCTSRSWRKLAVSNSLWAPLLAKFLASRAHLPLSLLRDGDGHCNIVRDNPYSIYCLVALDAVKRTLTPVEMCARVWELKVKPTCGPYWYSLDPTSHGKDPLLRRFHCDHSITALREDDPIWGGQECNWRFVKRKDNKDVGQSIQINKWPHHHVVRLSDGRWRLDNIFACYTTCPDRDENMPSYFKAKLAKHCPNCNPGPATSMSCGLFRFKSICPFFSSQAI